MLGRVLLSESPSGRALAGYRRRPLALLAMLAASGDRGISRERLLLYLWPESDARHGRNTLSQTLYALKRDLDSDQVVIGTAILSLNRAVISCDQWEFERAFTDGAYEEAVRCYGGAFLNDFAIPGLPEFEHWVGTERSRLERSHRIALERLAASAEAEGDAARATLWWRRLADAAPLSAAAAMGLMRSLASSGDRSAALEHARSYTALVRHELDSEPESAISALVDRIRRAGTAVDRTASGAAVHAPFESGLVGTAGTPDRAMAGGRPPKPQQSFAASSVERAPASVDPPAPQPVELSAFLERSGNAVAEPNAALTEVRPTVLGVLRLVGLLLAVAVFLSFMAAMAPDDMGIRSQQPSGASDMASSTVAVLPFAVIAPDSLSGRDTRVEDLLTTSLEGADVELADRTDLPAWPERDPSAARGLLPTFRIDDRSRLRENAYVVGEVALTAERVQVTARWYERSPEARRADGGREILVTSAASEGEPSTLRAVVDRVAAQLLAGRHKGAASRLTRVAAGGTLELAAFKAYLRGEQKLRQLEYAAAVDEFSRAVAVDSSFALAHYRLSVAATQAGRSHLARAAAERATALASSLTERDRSLVRALAASRVGDLNAAERLYGSIVSNHADDLEAWIRLGELRFHGNPLLGRSALKARSALDRAARLDTTHGEALGLLARIAAREERPSDVDSLLARLLIGRSAAAVLEAGAVQSLAEPHPGLHWSAWTQMSALSERAALTRAALTLKAAVDPAAMWEVARPMTRPQLSPDVRVLGYKLLTLASAVRGQWTTASTFLDSVQLLDQMAALELRAQLASAPFLRVPGTAQRDLVAKVSAWSPYVDRASSSWHSPRHAGLHAHIRLHSLGLLHGALQEHERAARLADSLERLPSPPGAPSEAGRLLAQSVRATSAFHGGRYADVLRILGSTPSVSMAGILETEVHDRFVRAESLFRIGRLDEAARWYLSIAQRTAYEQVYRAPSELRLGEIAERRREPARAARHYEHFVNLWATADADLQPVVATARKRLALLPGPDAAPSEESPR